MKTLVRSTSKYQIETRLLGITMTDIGIVITYIKKDEVLIGGLKGQTLMAAFPANCISFYCLSLFAITLLIYITKRESNENDHPHTAGVDVQGMPLPESSYLRHCTL